MISHPQTHYRDLEGEKQYKQQKTESGIQNEDNEKEINFLKLEKSSQKPISRKGRNEEIGTSSTEDSDIEVPKLLDYIEIADPKAAKMGEMVRFVHDAKEKDGLLARRQNIRKSHESI